MSSFSSVADPARTSLEMYDCSVPWALLSDGYAWTMAQGWQNAKMMQRNAVFYAHFQKFPPHAGFAVFGGSDYLAEWITRVRIDENICSWLASLTATDGTRQFNDAFLSEISGRRLSIDIETVPEGSVCFPQEPLIKARGPLWQLELIEGGLLNFALQQTNVMSRAARMCEAANWEPVVDNSLRRGNGIDGSVSQALAAYKGGFAKLRRVKC